MYKRDKLILWKNNFSKNFCEAVESFLFRLFDIPKKNIWARKHADVKSRKLEFVERDLLFQIIDQWENLGGRLFYDSPEELHGVDGPSVRTTLPISFRNQTLLRIHSSSALPQTYNIRGLAPRILPNAPNCPGIIELVRFAGRKISGTSQHIHFLYDFVPIGYSDIKYDHKNVCYIDRKNDFLYYSWGNLLKIWNIILKSPF